jgi:hypothetical protein
MCGVGFVFIIGQFASKRCVNFHKYATSSVLVWGDTASAKKEPVYSTGSL